MLLSEDKISHLSHLILTGLSQGGKTALLAENEKVLREIKRVITNELRMEDEIDQTVQAKLATYSRRLSEGSPEWEVLYHKFFEEERKKRQR